MVKSGPVARTFDELLDVLDSKTIYAASTGCYLWQGHTAGEGYGVISFEGKQVYIHRIVYEKTFGVKPNVLRHSCDNPNCWFTGHLIDGSHADNVQDKVSKLRHGYGEKHYNSKMTEAIVREIRSSGLSLTELVKKYGFSKGAIYCVLTRATWRHVP